MNWLLSNPHLIVGLVVILGSAVQWILKTVAEQKAARQRRLQIEQQELEALRTGRESAKPMGVPSEFSREAELAELRRRAQARAEQSSRDERVDPGMPSPTPAQQPNPLEVLLGLPPGSTTGGTVPSRGGKPRDIAAERRKRREARAGTNRPAPTTPTPASNSSRSDNVRSDTQRRDNQSSQDKFSDETRAERVRSQGEERLRVDKIRREEDRRATARSEAAQQQRIAAAHAATEVASPTPQTLSNAPRRTGALKVKGLPNSRASWRQALIVNEILNKPLALRTDADRGIL